MNNSPHYFEAAVKDAYAIDFEVTEKLSGIEDDNFVIKCWNDTKYIVKIVNAADSKTEGLVEALVDVISRLQELGCQCQQVLPTITGHSTVFMRTESGFRKAILLSYIDGQVLKDIQRKKSLHFMELCTKVGEFVGRMHSKMKTVKELPEVLQRNELDGRVENISDLKNRLKEFKNRYVGEICEQTIARLQSFYNGHEYQLLQTGLIHGDLTLNNLIIEILSPSGIQINGVVNFMDARVSCYVFEIAVTLCSVMHEALASVQVEPIKAALLTLKSYNDNFPLNVTELDNIFDALISRLCIIRVLSCNDDNTLHKKSTGPPSFDFSRLDALIIKLWDLGNTEWKRLLDIQLFRCPRLTRKPNQL